MIKINNAVFMTTDTEVAIKLFSHKCLVNFMFEKNSLSNTWVKTYEKEATTKYLQLFVRRKLKVSLLSAKTDAAGMTTVICAIIVVTSIEIQPAKIAK
jgi:hypothetical protein